MGGATLGGAGTGAAAGSSFGPWGTLIGAGVGAVAGTLLAPSEPKLPKAPATPDMADAAMRNARLMERRKQLGLSGRMSTFLTTAQGEGGSPAQPAASPAPVVNLLGG